MGQLYKITFKTSGKSYIGITTGPVNRRWRCHSHPKNNHAIGCAFRKYGLADATITILAECASKKELCAMEIAAILEHQTRSPLGYNEVAGGFGITGFSPTPQQRAENAARQKIAQNRPEIKAANAARTKKMWESQDFAKAQSTRLKKMWESPEKLAAASARGKARWESLEARKIQSMKIKLTKNKPEARAIAAQQTKQRYESQAERAIVSARAKKMWASTDSVVNSQEYRAAHSERAKKQFSSPLARIRHRVGIATGEAIRAGRVFSYINAERLG